MATVLSLVEPVLLVVMAVIVAGMLLAFYLPMFQAISAVQGARVSAIEDARALSMSADAARALASRPKRRPRGPWLPLRPRVRGRRLLRARPRDPEVGAGGADVPLRLPAYRREGDRLVLVMADPTDIPVVDELSLMLQTQVQPAVGTPSAIQEALKRGQGTQRVLEQASESFKIQLLRDDDNGDEVLSIDKIQADQSPIIRLVDSTVFDALNRRAPDIHIETRDAEVVIKYRIDGVLQRR